MYEVHRGLIPRDVCERAKRRLFLEIRRCGLSTDDMAEWSSTTWWPSLRNAPEIQYVQAWLEDLALLPDDPVWAEPQILIRLPDEDRTELGDPHLDELPPWADGLEYYSIYGVELTETPANGGGTVLYPDGLEGLSVKPQLAIGDALRMEPDLLHSGSPNLSAEIRVALFFRLLERS